MRLIGAIAAAAAAAAIAAVHVDAAAPPILFVGDSITYGYYASTSSHAFPALVAAHLHRPAVKMAKAGVTASYYAGAVTPKASTVVVELGTNDYAHQTPLASFDRAYKRVIAAARHTNPSAKLVCVTVWHDTYANPGKIPSVDYDAKIRGDCTGGSVADVSAAYGTETDRGPAGSSSWLGKRDAFHPNDAGHRAIAAAVLSALH